jgi:hypothetical protein
MQLLLPLSMGVKLLAERADARILRIASRREWKRIEARLIRRPPTPSRFLSSSENKALFASCTRHLRKIPRKTHENPLFLTRRMQTPRPRFLFMTYTSQRDSALQPRAVATIGSSRICRLRGIGTSGFSA